MSMLRTFLCGLTLVAATAVVTSQVVSQEADSWLKFSQPSAHHDILDRIAGKWDFQGTVWDSPGAEPETFTMNADYRWTLGGRFLIGNYVAYIGGERFEAKDVLGYDNFRGQYSGLWIDNETTAFTLSRGRYDQGRDTLILEGTQDDVGRKVKDEPFRFVYLLGGDDRMAIESFIPGDGGKMFRRVRVEATRAD
ncbi:MAG: DUF1579 family protein [Planctomycetota bacterium]|jgi:hypothetical protein